MSCTVGLVMRSTCLSVKRTVDSHKEFITDMKVHFCGFGITVPKQSLYASLIYTLFHEVGGKTVP